MIVHHYRDPNDIPLDPNDPIGSLGTLLERETRIITVERRKSSCPTCGGTGRVKQYSVRVGLHLTAKEFFMIDKNGIKHTLGTS